MLNLVEKNKELLADGVYKLKDKQEMQKVDSLREKNDYDLYKIVCCLCNYDIPEIVEARDMRMELFIKTNNGSQKGFEHNETDYGKLDIGIQCKNTGNVNKFGLYEFELNKNDNTLTSQLWEYKSKDCLKYVNNKDNPDITIVSISKYQFENFITCLDQIGVTYDIDQMKSNLFYDATSNIELKVPDALPFTPYDFQIEDANKIIQKKRMLIGHDMGCGKTFMSIIVGGSIDTKKVVICPESLRLNWKKEIESIYPDADVQILLSNENYHTGEDWTILGYKTVKKFLEELKEFKCVFVDECHACKAVNNWGKPTSQRASAVLELADNAEYCYLLTGTPMPSHNKDLFNILKMLKCEEFDFNNQWAFKNFGDKFCDPKDTYFGKDYNGSSNSEQLHEILSKLMVRRRKAEVLPNLTKQRQFIPIEPKFKKDYKEIEKSLFNPWDDKTYMALAMTGRQILSQYKIKTAIDLADSLLDADEQVVIVTNFNETMDKLIAHYKDDCCVIRGGMSDEDKQKSKEDFQAGRKKVCLLNIIAGGVGITLTKAHSMVVIDYTWTPSDMTQVEDRICRVGQEEPCVIYYVNCINSTLDKTFIRMISSKSENINTVVDNVENDFDLVEESSVNQSFIDELKKEIKNNTKETKTVKKKKKSA